MLVTVHTLCFHFNFNSILFYSVSIALLALGMVPKQVYRNLDEQTRGDNGGGKPL